MKLFLSAGEPSGDLHGANLIRAVRARDPAARVSGFGGRRMLAARADLLFPLTDLAVMGLVRVLANLRTFFRLGRQAEAFFHTDRPDAVVVFIGANEGFPMPGPGGRAVQCCGPQWAAVYAT